MSEITTKMTALGIGALALTSGLALVACGGGSGDGDATGDTSDTGDTDDTGDTGDGDGDNTEPAPSCDGPVGGPYAWAEGGVALAADPKGIQLAVAGNGTAMSVSEDWSVPAVIWGYYGGSGEFAPSAKPLALTATQQARLAGTLDGFVALWPNNGKWKFATNTGDAGWSDPVNVGDAGSGAALDASDDGDAVAVWHQNGSAHGNVLGAGKGWAGATTLGDGVETEIPLATAMSRNGGWAVAAWSGTDKVVVVDQQGGEWGSPADLSGEGNWIYDIELATDCSGASYVVWAQGDKDEGFQEGTVRIYTARHDGSSWGDVEQLDAGGIPFGGVSPQTKPNPSFGMGVNGDGVVAWVDRPTSSVVASVRTAGGGWGAPEAIGDTDEGGDMTLVAGADRDGNASVLYNFGNGRLQQIRYDGSWSPAETLRNSGGSDKLLLGYADDGTAVLLAKLTGQLRPFHLR